MIRVPIAALAAHAAEAALTAHHAAAAAHHLVGKRGDLLAVDVDRAAGEGRGSVVVKTGIAVDADGAAGDDDIAVGVDAVGIARAHRDGQRAAGDLHGRRVRGGLARSVDAVVRG